MHDEYQMVWDGCLRTIKKNVNPQSFKTWFEPVRPVRLDSNVLTIQVPNKFFFEWLEEHYVSLLKLCVKQELGDKGRLEYQILMGGNTPTHSPINISAADQKPQANQDNEPAPGVFDAESIKNPFIIPGIRKIKVDSQLNPNYRFDNYIEGDCNRLARSAGIAIAKKPGGTSFNPLIVFGEVGLGKTHLVQAIGNEIVAQYPNKSVLYVPAEKFTNQLIQSIKNNSINEFSNYYQMLDVLIMDDIQFISGKQKTQEIFFHIFNQLHQSGKQIILTSDRAPKDLVGMEDRLISRFKWGLSADLQVPDLETRMAIMHFKKDYEGIEIPADVIELICYNVKDNIRELEGVLVSLLAHSTLDKKSIDIDLAKQVIKSFVHTQNREITVQSIQQTVAEYYNLTIDKLHTESRRRNFVVARQVAMYLSKQLTRNPLKSIGEAFGGRDHSTVIYSCKAIQDMMDTDLKFKAEVDEIEKNIKMSVK